VPDNTGNDKAVGDEVRDEDNSPYPRHSIGCFWAICGFGSECIRPKFERLLPSTHLSLYIRTQSTDLQGQRISSSPSSSQVMLCSRWYGGVCALRVATFEARPGALTGDKASSLPICVEIRSSALQGSPTVLLRVPYSRNLCAARDLVT
jgi:hypothetical protein